MGRTAESLHAWANRQRKIVRNASSSRSSPEGEGRNSRESRVARHESPVVRGGVTGAPQPSPFQCAPASRALANARYTRDMRSIPVLIVVSLFAVACGSEGTGPRPPDGDGARMASEFERLADSVESGGYSPAAEALRHAAVIVRLTGHATPVSVYIDGHERTFVAVAEQIDFPNLVCSWPSDTGAPPPPDTVSVPPPDSGRIPPQPPDTVDTPPSPPDSTISALVDSTGGVNPPAECQAEGTYSMRTLIAWEPEHMNEVGRLVAHIGSGEVQPNVPDVMTGLPGATMDSGPSTTPPDSGSGSGG